MAPFYQFRIRQLARVLSLRSMMSSYEYSNMHNSEEKRRLYQLMRELSAEFADEVGHVQQLKNGLVQMDYHCKERWFYDWMLIPTQVRPLDESEQHC